MDNKGSKSNIEFQMSKRKVSDETKISENVIGNLIEEDLVIPERIYVNRDSVLTELFQISHFNSLLNMFYALIILMFIYTIATDWSENGLFQHLHHISWVIGEFSQLHVVILSLLILYGLTFVTFSLVEFWIKMKLKWKQFEKHVDLIFLIFYLLIISCIVIIPVIIAINIHIPPCSSAFVVYEQIRIFMKLHAYIRTIVPQIYELLNSSESDCSKLENVNSILSKKQFMYFLIIPTLIYRKSYPMRKTVNYKIAINFFIQFVMCIIFMYYIFITIMRPIFVDFNPSFMTKGKCIPILFRAILPTILMMLTMFYCFLHLWLNAFAELTKFGDRQFYKDWWNATSLSDYFRTWNALIHDWLFTYIYRDVAILIFRSTKNKRMAKSLGMVSVLLVSSLVHEYVLAFCFKFFYPVLLTVFFTFGTILYFVKANRTSRMPNVMMWTGLFIGNTIFVSFYSLEWYSRRNCIRNISGYGDFFIPRSWFCEKL